MKRTILAAAIAIAAMLTPQTADAWLSGCSGWINGDQAGVYCQSGNQTYRARVTCRVDGTTVFHSYVYGPSRSPGTWSSSAWCPPKTYAASVTRV